MEKYLPLAGIEQGAIAWKRFLMIEMAIYNVHKGQWSIHPTYGRYRSHNRIYHLHLSFFTSMFFFFFFFVLEN